MEPISFLSISKSPSVEETLNLHVDKIQNIIRIASEVFSFEEDFR